MRNARLFDMIRNMSHGERVVAVFDTMDSAVEAFAEVRRMLDKAGVQYEARKSNSRVYVKLGEGSIRFTSDRSQLRGYYCHKLYLDECAMMREWMMPMVVKA